MESKISKFLSKGEGKKLEDSGSVVSKEYAGFQAEFKKVICHLADGVKARLVAYHNGHYDMSGFLQRNDKFVYFNYCGNIYERATPFLQDGAILIRKAQGIRDFTGGSNFYTSLSEFQRLANRLLR